MSDPAPGPNPQWLDESGRFPIETQLALIRRDIAELHRHLCGNGEKGLLRQVGNLTVLAERGRWSLRVALWVGGAIIAVTTAAAQFKHALTMLLR
jgi:hypothetical protein